MSGPYPEEEEPRVVIRDKRRIDPDTGEVRQQTAAQSGDAASWSAADAPKPQDSGEIADLRTQVVERTADLQRVSAEYANYRKRVDRDRVAVVEQATASVLGALLPVLDDIDRAAEHGDLTGPFKAVADQVQAVLGKLGLESFGEAGDPFDPIVHEAVMHSTSPEVTEPTAVTVMRRGYKHGERLLRPAMVAVADPEPQPEPTAEPAPKPEPAVEDTGWTEPRQQ